MKRAKQPPHPELVGECQVIADMLTFGRRAEIVECPALGIGPYPAAGSIGTGERDQPVPNWTLHCLTLRAMSEYLRLFPKARKPNDDPWQAEPLTETITYDRSSIIDKQLQKISGLTVKSAVAKYVETVSAGEIDYQCFFCRKSLYTRPTKQRFQRGGDIHRKILRHTEVCAVHLLAGLMKPHPPLPKGNPGL